MSRVHAKVVEGGTVSGGRRLSCSPKLVKKGKRQINSGCRSCYWSRRSRQRGRRPVRESRTDESAPHMPRFWR